MTSKRLLVAGFMSLIALCAMMFALVWLFFNWRAATATPLSMRASAEQRREIAQFGLVYLHVKHHYVKNGVLQLPTRISDLANETRIGASFDWGKVVHYAGPVDVSDSTESANMPIMWTRVHASVSSEERLILFADGRIESGSLVQTRPPHSTLENKPMNDDAIRAAVHSILHGQSEDGYMFVEGGSAPFFVEITGSAGLPILFRVRKEQLSDPQQDSVRLFLTKYDSFSESQSGFTVDLGRNIDICSKLVVEIFREIFGVDDPSALNVVVH